MAKYACYPALKIHQKLKMGPMFSCTWNYSWYVYMSLIWADWFHHVHNFPWKLQNLAKYAYFITLKNLPKFQTKLQARGMFGVWRITAFIMENITYRTQQINAWSSIQNTHKIYGGKLFYLLSINVTEWYTTKIRIYDLNKHTVIQVETEH